MYADDVRLCIEVGVINAYVKMSVDMKRIVHWAHLWQLKVNVKKYGILHVCWAYQSFCIRMFYKIQNSVSLPV